MGQAKRGGAGRISQSPITHYALSVTPHVHLSRTTPHAPRLTHHASRITHHAPRTTHHASRTTVSRHNEPQEPALDGKSRRQFAYNLSVEFQRRSMWCVQGKGFGLEMARAARLV